MGEHEAWGNDMLDDDGDHIDSLNARIAALEAENERQMFEIQSLRESCAGNDKRDGALRSENERLREIGRGLLIAVLDDYPNAQIITVAGTGIHINVQDARQALAKPQEGE